MGRGPYPDGDEGPNDTGKVMRDDPHEIASYLIQQYGVDGAIAAVTEEIRASQEPGAFYGLSVWREVRRVLRERRDQQPRRGPGGRTENDREH